MKSIEVVLMGIIVIILVAIFSLVLAFPTMWCWNHTVSPIFNLVKITWGQAWCLQFLTNILLKATVTTKT